MARCLYNRQKTSTTEEKKRFRYGQKERGSEIIILNVKGIKDVIHSHVSKQNCKVLYMVEPRLKWQI